MRIGGCQQGPRSSVVHSGRGRWEEDTLRSFTMTKESLRPGCLSNASMRETNIISDTGGADRMKRSQHWMDYWVFYFFLTGVERGRGHIVASQTADGGFSLFLMGKCHRAPQTPTRKCFRNAHEVTSARQMGCFTVCIFFFGWMSPQIKRHKPAELHVRMSVYLPVRVLMKQTQ